MLNRVEFIGPKIGQEARTAGARRHLGHRQHAAASDAVGNGHRLVLVLARDGTDGLRVGNRTGNDGAVGVAVLEGDTLIVAEFDPGNWTGDLKALTKIDKNGGWSADNMQTSWTASALMPARESRNVWTVDPTDPDQPYTLQKYTDDTLAGDN